MYCRFFLHLEVKNEVKPKFEKFKQYYSNILQIEKEIYITRSEHAIFNMFFRKVYELYESNNQTSVSCLYEKKISCVNLNINDIPCVISHDLSEYMQMYSVNNFFVTYVCHTVTLFYMFFFVSRNVSCLKSEVHVQYLYILLSNLVVMFYEMYMNVISHILCYKYAK